MKHFLILAILLAIGCSDPPRAVNVSPQPDSGIPPRIPDGSLFRPSFVTSLGTARAGTAFPVSLQSSPHLILVSALHLIGPAGGLPKTISSDAIDTSVSSIVLEDLFNEDRIHRFDAVFVELHDTAPMGEKSKHGDIVAFVLPDHVDLKPLEFASSLPHENAPIWLAAQLVGGAPATQKLHRGIYLGVDEGLLVVQFDNPELELRATSGAPIIDSDGKVVAINLGGWTDSGVVYGVGNSITRFRKQLENAARNR